MAERTRDEITGQASEQASRAASTCSRRAGIGAQPQLQLWERAGSLLKYRTVRFSTPLELNGFKVSGQPELVERLPSTGCSLGRLGLLSAMARREERRLRNKRALRAQGQPDDGSRRDFDRLVGDGQKVLDAAHPVAAGLLRWRAVGVSVAVFARVQQRRDDQPPRQGQQAQNGEFHSVVPREHRRPRLTEVVGEENRRIVRREERARCTVRSCGAAAQPASRRVCPF